MEKDFKTWLMFKVAFSEIAFEYNTGEKYQHKQDLVAIFWNSYIYYQQKAEAYFKEFGVFPCEVINDLIFEFRQHFPKNGRVEGVNYFDDLLEQLRDKLSNQSEPIDKSKEIAEFLDPKYILGLNEVQISKSYTYFKDYFNPLLTYKNYLDCFNENETPKHPKLITGKTKIFVYFLCEAGINESTAIARFGIKSFATTKSRNEKINLPRSKNVSEIQSLLKL